MLADKNWAQTWPRKCLTLLFNYFMCLNFKSIYSTLYYIFTQDQNIFWFVQNFVFQIGQENYVRPGNSDIILRIPIMIFPIKDNLGCLVLYIVNYSMVCINIKSKIWIPPQICSGSDTLIWIWHFPPSPWVGCNVNVWNKIQSLWLY